MITVVVAVAGGLGAAARFLVDDAVRSRSTRSLPLGTTLVNVTGSLALGLVTGMVLFHGSPGVLTQVAGTGFLGGYTTFSTASVETVRLAHEGRWRAAVLHAGSMLVLSLAAAGAGLGAAAALAP